MHPSRIVLPCMAVAFSACLGISTVTADQSSRSYLSLQESSGLVNRDPQAAAREVTQLLSARGYSLMDRRSDAATGAAIFRFATRGNAIPSSAYRACRGCEATIESTKVGSVIYAWIVPDGATGSRIELFGRPSVGDVDVCDTFIGHALPCRPADEPSEVVAQFLTGRTEADTIHGLLAELQVQGFVAGPLPATAQELLPSHGERPSTAPSAACLAQRQRIFREANQLSDPYERAQALESAPVCNS